MEQALLEEHILNLEKRLMSYDFKELEELLAEEFMEFGSSGNAYNKKDQLATVSGVTMNKTIPFTVTDFKIKFLGTDVILATYRTYYHPNKKHALRSSIWKLNNDNWQMLFHQGTPTNM